MVEGLGSLDNNSVLSSADLAADVAAGSETTEDVGSVLHEFPVPFNLSAMKHRRLLDSWMWGAI